MWINLILIEFPSTNRPTSHIIFSKFSCFFSILFCFVLFSEWMRFIFTTDFFFYFDYFFQSTHTHTLTSHFWNFFFEFWINYSVFSFSLLEKIRHNHTHTHTRTSLFWQDIFRSLLFFSLLLLVGNLAWNWNLKSKR